MKKIIILSHNPHRDYHSDNLLANELISRGHCVWLRRFLSNDGMAICTIKPDIIVLPEARIEYTVSLAKECKKIGIKTVVKSCEFGITEESIPKISDDYRTAIFGHIPIGDSVDKVIVWGPKMKEMMSRYTDAPSSNIVCCGGYQFDSYFFRPTVPPKKEMSKPTLLFATGFPYADRNRQYSVPEAPLDSSIHKKFVDTDSKIRGTWLSSLKKIIPVLAEKWNIIIKPHAGEQPEAYSVVLKGLPFELVMEETGYQTLMRSDMIVHAGSTMGFEAHLLNIPSLNFHNNNRDVIFQAVSPMVNTDDELLSAIENTELKVSNANGAIVDKLISEYWGPIDGKGYERVADVVESIPIQKDKKVPDMWPYPTEARYLSDGVYPIAMQWHCSGCEHIFFSIDTHREMIKCPYCGIACVKVAAPNPSQQPKPEN